MADIYDIAASGMSAQRTQMDLLAQNLANAGLARADGTVFHPKTAVFVDATSFESSFSNALASEGLSDVGFDEDSAPEAPGVEVADVVDRAQSVQYRYDPGSPFAAQSGQHKGYVALPDVDPIEQMVELVSAGRAYDANVSMLTAAKQMDTEAADIDRA